MQAEENREDFWEERCLWEEETEREMAARH